MDAIRDQNQGVRTVTVLDATGASVPDAAVVLTRSTEQRALATGPEGSVAVRGLTAGAWSLDVSRDGFVTVRRPVVVQSTPVFVMVTLEVGGLRQNVIVEVVRPEDALQLDASAAAASGSTSRFANSRPASRSLRRR